MVLLFKINLVPSKQLYKLTLSSCNTDTCAGVTQK